MVLIPEVSKIACISHYCVRYAYLLLLIIPLIIFLFWFIRKTFVRFPNRLEQETYLASKRKIRRVIFFLRAGACTLLLIALASPFILESKTVPGNPRLTVLLDNSSSMDIYNQQIITQLYDKLSGAIPVQFRSIAYDEHSTLGDGILNNIEGDDNVLVFTDGNNNEGKLLGDIMLFASSINTTVSTIAMEPEKKDVAVTVIGPSQVIRDSEGEFKVHVEVVGGEIPYTLEVKLDDAPIMSQSAKETKDFMFERKFSDAKYHTITARLTSVGSDDFFAQNNAFYKSIKVVPRPKILFVSAQNSPLASNLDKIYEIDIVNFIPSDISEYYAVVLNNLPASKILPHFDALNDFVLNGNGLIVIGGEQAYESGNYKGTLFETLLPATMGSGEEENKSDVNIGIVIDISSGTADYVAVEKALAISVLESLNEKNNVGAVAFGGPPPCRAYKIADVLPLKDAIKELADKIARLKFDGQSCFNIGLEGGYDLLKDYGGSKNIIFISDGKAAGNSKLKTDTIEVARQMSSRGFKVYVVGVGTQTDEAASDNNLFLANIAAIGNGIYFRADAQNKLKVLFGEPSESEQNEEYFNALTVLDETHFITETLDLHATISGYNYLVPKPAARLLVTTNKKIPVVTVWRFGLGRVVALGTDDGSQWAGELLNKQNSKMITKSINWAIGDLTRKEAFDVTIADVTLGKKGIVEVVSKDMPTASGLSFAKVDVNRYEAIFTPAEQGFHSYLDATYGVNYNSEYAKLGINKEFTTLVEKTGGKIFGPDDTTGIIEFIKAKSKRIKIHSTDYRWPFIVSAVLLFLIEIGYRRKIEDKKE